MKYIILPILLGFIATAFSQNKIVKSGTWCNADLILQAELDEGAILMSWTKDGVIIDEEKSKKINCVIHGLGEYKLTYLKDGVTADLIYDLNAVSGPVANFKATNYDAAAATFFKDESSSIEKIVSWYWDFGNGETANEQNPKIMFKERKVYDVTLTITTSSGCSNTIVKKHKWGN